MKDKINVLGTEYRIMFKSDEEVAKDMLCNVGECGGYCSPTEKLIVIAMFDKLNGENEESKEYLKKWNMRHEITHAFLNESGLSDNANEIKCWAKNEEMFENFTLNKGEDFFVIVKKEDLGIDVNLPEGMIDSDNYEGYSGGFFEYVKTKYGYAFGVDTVDVYTLIPRFEIGGK